MKHVLVVDDSAIIRRVASQIIETFKMRPSEADTKEKAIAHCGKSMPDVILLDWSMPETDSIELIRLMRRLPDASRAKIVYCVTENEPVHLAMAMRAGADDFVMKPFDRASLEAKFQEVGLIE